MRRTLLIQLIAVMSATAQDVRITEAPPLLMPAAVDSNSPGFWRNGQFYLFNSTGGGPVLSRGPNQFQLSRTTKVLLTTAGDWPTWIESVWPDPAGPVFAFYHQEDFSRCQGSLSQPQIGMAVSYDRGLSFRDLGLVLTSGVAPDCAARNGYFAGGHGDVSVIADADGGYFYFLFGNYNGPLETQGVVTARLAISDRYTPAGRAWKYFGGGWSEPGLGGKTSPIFPATVSWQREDTDSFWGPSIHWNTYLETYVILMNRSCCASGWPQEGIYITYNPDLSNPSGWSQPQKIVDGTHWYPQVLGTGPEETDSLSGKRARLWIYGTSEREIEFLRPEELLEDGTVLDAEPPEIVAPEEQPEEPDPAVIVPPETEPSVEEPMPSEGVPPEENLEESPPPGSV